MDRKNRQNKAASLLIKAAQNGDTAFLHKHLKPNDPRLDPASPVYIRDEAGRNLLDIAYAEGRRKKSDLNCSAIVELIVSKRAKLDVEAHRWDFDTTVYYQQAPYAATMELLACAATQFQAGMYVSMAGHARKFATAAVHTLVVTTGGAQGSDEQKSRIREILRQYPYNGHFVELLRSGEVAAFAKSVEKDAKGMVGHHYVMGIGLARDSLAPPLLAIIDELAAVASVCTKQDAKRAVPPR